MTDPENITQGEIGVRLEERGEKTAEASRTDKNMDK